MRSNWYKTAQTDPDDLFESDEPSDEEVTPLLRTLGIIPSETEDMAQFIKDYAKKRSKARSITIPINVSESSVEIPYGDLPTFLSLKVPEGAFLSIRVFYMTYEPSTGAVTIHYSITPGRFGELSSLKGIRMNINDALEQFPALVVATYKLIQQDLRSTPIE